MRDCARMYMAASSVNRDVCEDGVVGKNIGVMLEAWSSGYPGYSEKTKCSCVVGVMSGMVLRTPYERIFVGISG